MRETTYLPQVRCEISEGLTDTDQTVCIQDIDGRKQYIHVLPSLVNWNADQPYLPVGIVQVDRHQGRVLIELPIEADSGTNRMWMPYGAFLIESGVPA
jgi:hypothetical protein